MRGTWGTRVRTSRPKARSGNQTRRAGGRDLAEHRSRSKWMAKPARIRPYMLRGWYDKFHDEDP